MAAASTPPPPSVRAHTPPTPLHGPRADNYEPYSPRRSKRSTAHSNPYSSFNSERSPKADLQRTTTPPPTVKKARFARAPTQLSSPPSSPASPAIPRPTPQHKTPKKAVFNSRSRPVNGGGVHSDSDGPSNSSAAPTIDPITMLPTPSKTPKKRQADAIASTARVLNFQPNHPNDAMPSPRRIKKHARAAHSTAGFDLYDEEAEERNGADIAVYMDSSARVPEVDESEDNPFVGRKKPGQTRPQRSGRSRKSAEELDHEQRIDEAVSRDEGVTYVFRGKKIFRRFSDQDDSNDGDANSAVSGTPSQRRLKRQAGAAAQRPLTRSTIKPRLLFPSEEQLLEREQGAAAHEDDDEEAVTDIDMDHTTVRSPPTRFAGGGKKKEKGLTPPEPMSVGTDETFAARRNQGRSPFDSWRVTKAGKKRAAGEDEGAGTGKRTRGAVNEGSA